MKQVLIDRYGTPWEVARCADVPDVGAPADDEVVFDVLAFPINPADMWFCRGSYRLKPPLPATPGAECVGHHLHRNPGSSRLTGPPLGPSRRGRARPAPGPSAHRG